MDEQNQTPQSEDSATQSGDTGKTYTQADVDRIQSVWAEKHGRLERRAERYKTDLEKQESAYSELEKRAKELSDKEAAKKISQLEAEAKDLAGKYQGLRTGAIAAKVASELSADVGVVSTLIAGLRSQGVLEREPEDPAEAASAWVDAMREKHESFFTKPEPEPEPKAKPKAGVIPTNDETQPSLQRENEKRAAAMRRNGKRAVMI